MKIMKILFNHQRTIPSSIFTAIFRQKAGGKRRLRTPLIPAAFCAVLICAAVGFGQTKTGDDAQIYAEVKAALEKHEKVVDGSYQPTAEEADDALKGAAKALDVLTGGKPAAENSDSKKFVNQFDDILAKCETLIKHNPKLPDYYRLRGKARYFRTNSTDIYMFTESDSLFKPEFAAKFSSADISAGIRDFSDALVINPNAKLDTTDAADAHLFRGKLYVISAAKSYSKQNLQNALVDFDEAERLDDYNPPPDSFRKAIYLLSKDGDLVGQDFARLIKENPSDAASLYLKRASYFSVVVDYSKTLADLLRYANLPSADKTIIRLRYATLNKYAGDAYQNSNVSTAQAYLEKAALEIQFPAKEGDAFNDATEAVKLNSLLTAAHVIRSKVLIDKGQADEAIAEANVALAQDADNVGALCLRGLGLAVKNDIRTLDDFNRAILLDPELAFLYNAFGNRARIFTAFGKADLAAADTQKNEQLAQKLAEIRR